MSLQLENNKAQELISFITPFVDNNELIQPATRFSVKSYPASINVKLQIGLINLKKNSRYSIKLFITPHHLFTKVGNEFELSNPFQEMFSGVITTKDTDINIIDGQLNINIEDVIIQTEGIYSVECKLFDSKNEHTELNSLKSFFVVSVG